MTHFDDKGDLWIDLQLTTISSEMTAKMTLTSHAVPDPRNPFLTVAVTEMNLTDYIRRVIADSK
jgi:hypothetical protein